LAVDKLIPATELEAFLKSHSEAEKWDVAEHFWVTEVVVRLEIRSLR